MSDLSLVSVDSTTARAHHDAAGMRLAPGVLDALEKAAEEERARSKGARRKNKPGPGADDVPEQRRLRLKAARLGRSRGGQTTSPAPGLTQSPHDKAYSSRHNRAYLRRRNIQAVIPEKKDQTANRKKRGRRSGRPLTHDDLYKERNTVERLINKLKAWRGIATRYDKTPESYLMRPTTTRLDDLDQRPHPDRRLITT